MTTFQLKNIANYYLRKKLYIITTVLAVPLQVVWSATQVLPLACASRPQRSLTPGCTPWVAGEVVWRSQGSCSRWLSGGSARQLRGGKQELAPSAMVVRRGRIDG